MTTAREFYEALQTATDELNDESFRDFLTLEQRRCFKSFGYFVVKGKRWLGFGPRWRYKVGIMRGGGTGVAGACVGIRNAGSYPWRDNLIALKFWIEGNEREFRRVAEGRPGRLEF